MKELRNNLTILLAQKAKRERRRISLKKVADETGINKYTVYAIANDTIKEYSKDVLVKLCGYLDCGVGELLAIEEVPGEVIAAREPGGESAANQPASN
jgi:putative transcriptional regulator